MGQLGLAEADGPLPPEELEMAYREYLKNMSLYGLGNPVLFEMEDSSVRVKVENPYEVHIIAGTLQGLREALEKSRSAVEWEELSEGSVLYSVSPAPEPK